MTAWRASVAPHSVRRGGGLDADRSLHRHGVTGACGAALRAAW